MVAAILRGDKTQTRRIISPRNALWNGGTMPRRVWPQFDFDNAWIDRGPSPAGNAGPYLKVTRRDADDEYVDRLYSRVQVGDRFWVKETWRQYDRAEECPCYEDCACPTTGTVLFRASHDTGDEMVKWRPSIFMPKSATRISLEVTGLRPERIQSISTEDALAEGITWDMISTMYTGDGSWPQEGFKLLWDGLNADRGFPWEANNWVWVYTFKRVDDGPP